MNKSLNNSSNLKNKAIIGSILHLLKGYQQEMTRPIPNVRDLDNLHYLLGQSIRQYDIPSGNHHVSQEAHRRWTELSTDDINKYHYKDKVVCDNLCGSVTYDYYKGANKFGEPATLSKGSVFDFRQMFHEDHVIPVSLILGQMIQMQTPNNKAIENLLNKMHLCIILKEEDRKIGRTKGRSLVYSDTIEKVYNSSGVYLYL